MPRGRNDLKSSNRVGGKTQYNGMLNTMSGSGANLLGEDYGLVVDGTIDLQ